jgi:adenosylcobinamide-GDP ribazoletransferase
MTDHFPDESDAKIRPFAELIAALRFLTRLPVPFSRTIDHVPLKHAMRFFPVAGAVVGALTGLVLWGLAQFNMPPLLASVFAYAISIMLTGALHEDGIADTFDGLVGGSTRERRLEIMRDSRIGTYGTLALIVTAAAKITALFAFSRLDLVTTLLIITGAAAFSRALVVDVLWATKPARGDGLSHMAGRPSRNTVIIAILMGVILVFAAGIQTLLVASIYALAASLSVTGLIRIWATRKIGGQTGDICGAVQVLTEIAVLSAFASTLH